METVARVGSWARNDIDCFIIPHRIAVPVAIRQGSGKSYCSLSHGLIQQTLEKSQGPATLQTYYSSFKYSNLDRFTSAVHSAAKKVGAS